MAASTEKQKVLDAVIEGDLSRLKKLLHKGMDINAIYPNGKTLLIVAIEAQHRNIIDFLIKANIDVNQRDFFDRTHLMYAAEKSDNETVRQLIDAGVDVNARNKQGRTALMYAAYNHNIEIAQTLLDAGAELEAKDNKDRSALTYSAYKKGKDCYTFLVNQGALVKPLQPKSTWREFFSSIKTSTQNLFSMDEFSELREVQHSIKNRGNKRSASAAAESASQKSNSVFSEITGVIFFFIFVSGFLAVILLFLSLSGCGFPAALILFPLTILTTLFQYPSIVKIIPLGWDILMAFFGKQNETKTLLHQNGRSVHRTEEDDMGFVSQLMELGAKELSSLHLTYSDKNSLETKKSIFSSRLLSALMGGIVILAWFLYFLPGFLSPFGDIPGHVVFLAGVAIIFHTINFMDGQSYGKLDRIKYKLRLSRLQMVQKDRDRIAGELAAFLSGDHIEEGKLPTEFGLYLRAFMTTDKLHIKGFDLETVLAYSIAPTLPLIALGQPGEHLGSGRIQTTDEHWQQEILRLMDTARLILIIPSYRAGTLWEIATLRDNGYFQKTIFIMPPELEFHGEVYSTDWQKTVEAAREVGVEFPLHISSGLFFRLNQKGEFEDYAPLIPEEFMQEFDPKEFDAVNGAEHGYSASYDVSDSFGHGGELNSSLAGIMDNIGDFGADSVDGHGGTGFYGGDGSGHGGDAGSYGGDGGGYGGDHGGGGSYGGDGGGHGGDAGSYGGDRGGYGGDGGGDGGY